LELGANDRTLQQILQDEHEHDLFVNRFLYDRDPDQAKEIVDALADRTLLTAKHEKFLEKTRVEYNRRRAEVQKVQEMFDEEHIKRIAEVDPRIQEIIGQIGAQKATELIDEQFEELAIADGKTFDKIVKSLQSIKEIHGAEITIGLDRHVKETLQQYGISETKYFEATKPGETFETQRNLSKLVAEQYPWYKKAIDFGGWLSGRAGEKLYSNFEDQMTFLKECDKHFGAIGKMLQGTLNGDVRLAIQKYMLEGGSIREKSKEDTIRTIEDYRSVKAALDPAGRPQRWEEYKKAELQRRNIKDISKQPALQEQIKETFANREFKSQNQNRYKASGVIAALIALLFAALGPATKKDIKNSLAF